MFTSHKRSNSTTAVTDCPNNKKRYPGCLAHVVSGMFYSVVANRRQPNLYIIGGGEGEKTPEGKKTALTTACPESWKVKIMMGDKKKEKVPLLPLLLLYTQPAVVWPDLLPDHARPELSRSLSPSPNMGVQTTNRHLPPFTSYSFGPSRQRAMEEETARRGQEAGCFVTVRALSLLPSGSIGQEVGRTNESNTSKHISVV